MHGHIPSPGACRLVYSPDTFSFFLHYCSTHRDLHSFPTRRSSDLYVAVVVVASLARAFGKRHGGRRHHPRSEEHTSELQSRPHLVCRLLLEKKNIKELGLRTSLRWLYYVRSND